MVAELWCHKLCAVSWTTLYIVVIVIIIAIIRQNHSCDTSDSAAYFYTFPFFALSQTACLLYLCPPLCLNCWTDLNHRCHLSATLLGFSDTLRYIGFLTPRRRGHLEVKTLANDKWFCFLPDYFSSCYYWKFLAIEPSVQKDLEKKLRTCEFDDWLISAMQSSPTSAGCSRLWLCTLRPL